MRSATIMLGFFLFGCGIAHAEPVVCRSGTVCPEGMVCLEGGLCGRESGNCPVGFHASKQRGAGCLRYDEDDCGDYYCAPSFKCGVSDNPCIGRGPLSCAGRTCPAEHTCWHNSCLASWRKECAGSGVVCLRSQACAETKGGNKSGPDRDCVDVVGETVAQKPPARKSCSMPSVTVQRKDADTSCVVAINRNPDDRCSYTFTYIVVRGTERSVLQRGSVAALKTTTICHAGKPHPQIEDLTVTLSAPAAR